MDNDGVSVSSVLDIQLDQAGALLKGSVKGDESIFGGFAGSTAMTNNSGSLSGKEWIISQSTQGKIDERTVTVAWRLSCRLPFDKLLRANGHVQTVRGEVVEP